MANNVLPSFLTPANFGDSATGIGSPADVDRRRKLAAALTENGISTAPVESWTQGAARLAQALVGNIQNKRALAEETAGRKSSASALAAAMAGETPDYKAMAENPWIDQQTVLQMPNYVRGQRQNSAIDKMGAEVPEADKNMFLANPQAYIENKMKLDQMKAQMGMVDGIIGGGQQPPQGTEHIQQGPTFGTPLNRAGSPPPQVQQMAPGDQSQMQPVPQPQQGMQPPQIDLASIPIPPSVLQAAKIASLQSPGEAAKIINDYRMKMAEQMHNDYYKQPGYEVASEAAKAQGKGQGEAAVAYKSLSSKLPGLEGVVNQLDDLANKATYTYAGQAWNGVVNQLGQGPTEGALARTKYIAMVNNQILPMLRDTFGAQFTAREGDTLRETLGDPNKTPQEKQAVIKAFIEQARRNVEAAAVQAGQQPPSLEPSQSGNQSDPLGIRQ